jgi:DNA-binding response OmpR family regulator
MDLPMARILVVEDDNALARGLVALLKDGGYAVDHVDRGADALQLAQQEPYRAMILDVGLPDMSGFEVLRQLRGGGGRMPVLILTAKDAVADRVKGLDLGADDYLLKPFSPQELEARVRALVRRGEGNPSPVVRLGNLDWDRSNGAVKVNGRTLDLRRRELAVLQTLLSHVDNLVLKERLAAEVFDFEEPVGPNALEVYVGRVRRKLAPDGPTIRTVRGLGYLLEAS